MNFRLLRILSGSLSILLVAAPVPARVLAKSLAMQGSAPGPTSTASPLRWPRGILINDGGRKVLLMGPPGCTSNGSLSFNGGGANNVPGGYASGTLSGSDNRPCDADTTVSAGYNNVIGGDGGSYGAGIGAGIGNGIAISAGAIIGAGQNNIISDLPPYNNSNLSAIVAGFGNAIGSPDSFVGAGQANTIIPPAVKIGSGISPSGFIGAGYGNSISSDFAVVAGGFENAVSGEYATIGGGANNAVMSAFSAVLSGSASTVSAQYSFVGGGLGNLIKLSSSNGLNDSEFSVIAGGASNLIAAPATNGAQYSAISGGYENSVTGDFSAIGGGHNNIASGLTSTVAGGYANVASGQNGTIPGGASNLAGGRDSLAAGYSSQALNDGSFVWSDYSPNGKTVSSSANNQFLARASGGFFLYSSPVLASGVTLPAGSGSWSSLSDRAAKKCNCFRRRRAHSCKGCQTSYKRVELYSTGFWRPAFGPDGARLPRSVRPRRR
jgi:hypothetical protein